MKFFNKVKNRSEINKQIGNANKKLEVNKIVCKFRDYLQNISKEERDKILTQLRDIQKERSDFKFYIFLTTLGISTGVVSLYHLSGGDWQYLIMTMMGVFLTGIELRNAVYTSEYINENYEQFMDYFKCKVGVDKEVDGCMGDIKKHKLTGDNLDVLNEQLVDDACDMYVRNL